MEARRALTASLAVAIVIVACGAGYRTSNFVVDAPTTELAEKIGRAAEKYRHDLAVEWLGAAMPNWSQPCPIHAQVEPHLGAGGATSFMFDRGEVFGWRMEIQGSEERVLDSVLPHEVTHTVFASHFRRPLPRWADEGACTTVEHVSEKSKQDKMLITFLRTGRGIAFSQMFAMTDYPQDILPLYSQGYSLARYLIDQKGKHEFLTFLKEGMESDHWSETIDKYYGYKNLGVLQDSWLDWVKHGSPTLKPAADRAIVAAGAKSAPASDVVVRAQSADHDAKRDLPLAPVQAAGDVRVASAAGANSATPPAAPQAWPVRNGSVVLADLRSEPAKSAAPPAPIAEPARGQTENGPTPPPGKSVYGDGVGLIHHSAEAQQSPAADSPSPTPSSTAVPHTASRPREVLLEWNRN